MERRTVLAGVGTSLGATLAGCLGGTSEEGNPGEETSGGNCSERIQTGGDDSRFLEATATPGSSGAAAFLETVNDETDGLTRFKSDGETWQVGFSDVGDVWEVKYRGTPHGGDERFREEIAALSTAFASQRPDGVSLTATSLHECTTGTWHVCAETAAAYDRGEIDRETFVDRVYGTSESENNC